MPRPPLSVIDLRPTADLPDLGTIVAGVTARSGPATTEVRTTADTPDGRLLARGIVLEHRSTDGGTGRWVLEVPGGPGPIQWSASAAAVPGEAGALLAGVARSAPIAPATTTVTTSRLTVLEGLDGEVVAEVVDRVVDGDGSDDPARAERHRRVEVVGDARAVKALRRALRDLREVDGQPSRRPAPVTPRPAPPGGSLSAYVAGVVADGLDRLLAEDPRLRHDVDDDAVHQARVATRRLRSDLKTLAAILDPAWGRELRHELRWAGERLGGVRDADVLAERLRRRAGAHPDLPGTAALLRRIGDQRRAAADELRVALTSPRWLALLDALDDAAASPPVVAAEADRRRRPLEPALARLVGRPRRRLRDEVRALGDHPSDEALHRVRIRAKELRYAAEAASRARPEAAPLAVAAKGLQTVLGDHHDAVVAEAWLRAAAAATDDPAVAFAAGVLVGDERAEQAALRDAWPDAWRAVRAAPSKWLR
ncbi:MAG TPA: CHAD domain-containing protein [Acidimicrobiales bacterium]|nr:CHAD domain-containing protein [Acidimicrobiales bacterium]